MVNLLKEISSSSLLGKKVAYKDEIFKIGNATFYDKSLYISLIQENVSFDSKIDYHILNMNPERYINDLHNKIAIAKKTNCNVNVFADHKASGSEIIIEIKNPLLRDVCYDDEEDYEIRFNLGIDDNYNLLTENPECLYRSTDPNVWNNAGGFDITKRLFPTTINNLRAILYSAMGKEAQEMYKKQLKDYCDTITETPIKVKLNLLQEKLAQLKAEQENIENQCTKLSKTLELNEKQDIDILLY